MSRLLRAQDTFYVGTLKGVGRVYQQTFIDTYANVAFAMLYNRKTPITAAEILNDRVVPFYDEHAIRLSRVLTDRGTEFCGTQSHDYELYLAVEDIDHSRTKTKSPQTIDVIDKQFLCSAEAGRFSVPACGVAHGGGQDWRQATTKQRGLDHPEHGATLGYSGPLLPANLVLRTDDRVAKSRG